MIQGDDVLATQDEGMLPGVFELPHISGPGILENRSRPKDGGDVRMVVWPPAVATGQGSNVR